MTIAINQFFEGFLITISKYKTISIIVLALLLQIVTMLIISMLVFTEHPGGFEYRSITEHFFIAVIVGPVLETYIFQLGIINFALLTLKTGKLVAVLLSATGFALTHIYSIPYVVVTFFVGLLYATIYLSFVAKNVNAFWYLTLIHALYNLFAFVMNSLS